MALPVFDAKGNATGVVSGLTGAIVVGTLVNGALFVGINQGTAGTTPITAVQLDNGAGASFTQVGTTVIQNSTRSMSVWRLLNPPSGSHTIFVTATVVACTAIMVSFSGVDQTTPVGTPVTSTAQAPNATVTTPVDSLVIDWFGQQFNDTTGTPDASQTTLFTGIGAGVTVQTSASYKARTGATTNMQWTGSADGAYMAIPILPVAAAGRALFYQSNLDGLGTTGPKQFNPSL